MCCHYLGGPTSKAPSTSFEQLLASNDDINFADDDEDSDSRAHGGSSGADECPNSYDYCIHPNNYLVSTVCPFKMILF